MTSHAPSIARRIGFGVIILAVIARSLAIVFWGDIQFDADEAVTGLMAKHAAEGRALPVFQYAHRYVLVVEAWLMAPLMAVAPDSVTLVKAVPIALNVATAALLYATLTARSALGPAAALLVAAPIVLPATTTVQNLTDAVGMNIEPLLFTLLMWRWRERAVLLGITAAVAVKNREFALYAVAALLAVDFLRDRSAALWRSRLVALVAFISTSAAVEFLRLRSSPLGPDTSFAMLTGTGDNLAVATGAMCLDPAWMPHDLWEVATVMLPYQFGLRANPLATAAVYGAPAPDAPWLWGPLVIVLAAGAVLGLWRARRDGATQLTWFGLYLVLVGTQAAAVYALTRCGNVQPITLRYILLSLFMPVGALMLTLDRAPRWPIRAIATVVTMVWVGVCALDHLWMIQTLRSQPTQGSYRRLATYLDEQGTRFIVSDYWTGYQVAFLTRERIKALTNFERVREYTLAVQGNLDRAVEVRRTQEGSCAGAVVVADFYVCPPAGARSLP
jgi:hypothetical protein